MSEMIEESYGWYQGVMAVTCLGLIVFMFAGL